MIRVLKTALKSLLNFFGFEIMRKRKRNFDQIIHECFQKIQVTPRVVIDVGAHVGESINRFNLLFHTPKIYAFEANPSLANSLFTKHKESNVKVFSMGLGAIPVSQSFNFYTSSSGASSFLEVNPGERFTKRRGIREVNTEKALINVETLDGLYRSGIISEEIDFLKIDTQGTELDVLRGASYLLKNGLVKFIEFEIIVTPVYMNQEKWSSIIDYLLSHGYNLIALTNDVRFYNLGPFDILKNPELQIYCLFASESVYKSLLRDVS